MKGTDEGSFAIARNVAKWDRDPNLELTESAFDEALAHSSTLEAG